MRLKTSNEWIDISVVVQSGMVHWPGNADVRVERRLEISRGDRCNVSHMSLGAHTGTHMDGPLHFIRDGRSLDTMPLEATVGPARVIEIRDKESIKFEAIRKHTIRQGERILFKTRNSRRAWSMEPFDEDFVYIAKEAAQFLVDRGVQTVGVDYLSVGGFKKDGLETHVTLLTANIWIIEGLNLAAVKPGHYDLICLPLRVLKSDGAPARAILRARR